jgi:hypothetical protein
MSLPRCNAAVGATAMNMNDVMTYCVVIFVFTDVNIESPPSMYPAKKYCDISGFVVCIFSLWHWNSFFLLEL